MYYKEIEPFYRDHKRLILLTRTKLFELKLINFGPGLHDIGLLFTPDRFPEPGTKRSGV